MVKIRLYAKLAQLLRYAQANVARFIAHRRYVHVHKVRLRYRGKAFRHQQQPFHAHAEPYRVHLRPAKLLYKPIVTPAAANGAGVRALCRDKLEHGLCIIVEAPYYHGIDLVLYCERVKAAFKLLKVGFALRAKILQHLGGVRGYLAASLLLAVKYPQRVLFIAGLAGIAKRVIVFF